MFLTVAVSSADDAENAMATLRALKGDRDIAVVDAAVVARGTGGRLELQQTHELAAGESAVAGGTAGLIAGVLLGLPVGGALLGLAGGTLLGIRDTGIPDARLRELGDGLGSGQALLCVLVDADDGAAVREALVRYGAVSEVELSAGSEP